MQTTLEQIERALNITISEQDKQSYIDAENLAIINAYDDGVLDSREAFPVFPQSGEHYLKQWVCR